MNNPYVPYDPADEILLRIDIDKILEILSEQDRTILLWWLKDGHTLPEIAEKLKRYYGAPKNLTGRSVGRKVKIIVNKLRKYVGKKDLTLRERIKNNRVKKVKFSKKYKKKQKFSI